MATKIPNTESQRKPWLRLYRDSLHNPKVVTLSDRQHRAWHNCMLIADDDGVLPPSRDIACHLRMTIPEAEQIINDLVDAGLVDVDAMQAARVFRMHDWSTHQYVSDNSTPRSRKHREKKRATLQQRQSDDDAAPPEAEAEADTDSDLAKAKRVEKIFGSCLASRGVSPRLREKAEGLGLPVAEMLKRASDADVREPNAMFRHIAVEHLQRMLPNAPPQMLKASLTKDGEAAFASVCQLLLEESP